LGNTPFAREAAYADLMHAGVSASLNSTMMDATLKGWALGSPEFLQALQKQTLRRLTKGQAGRPMG
jgi:putative transposase